MGTDPFESSKLLLAHARLRMREFSETLRSFTASNPFELKVHHNKEDSHKVVSVGYREALPQTLSFNAWECFNALRSALDHATFACARANLGNIPADDGRLRSGTSFPFAKEKADLPKQVPKKVPVEVIDVIMSFRPYSEPDGDKSLYALNEVRNIGIHRLFAPFAILSSLSWKHHFSPEQLMQQPGERPVRMPRLFLPLGEWDDTKQELILAVFDDRTAPEYGIGLPPQVIFGYIKGLAGPDPIARLEALAAKVEAIVGAIEHRSKEIRLFVLK